MITIQKDQKKRIKFNLDHDSAEIDVYRVKNTETGEEGGWVTANVFIDDGSWVDPNSHVICVDPDANSINLIGTSIYDGQVIMKGGTLVDVEITGNSIISSHQRVADKLRPLIKNAEIRNGSILKVFNSAERVEIDGIKMDEGELRICSGAVIRDLEMNTGSLIDMNMPCRLNGVIMGESSIFGTMEVTADVWVNGLVLEEEARFGVMVDGPGIDDETHPAILISNLTVEEDSEYEINLDGQDFKYRLVIENEIIKTN